MADLDHDLYWELKSRYPEVPDSVVKKYILQYNNNRERCIEMLANESPKYLFETCDQLSDLHFGGARPRSNSSGNTMINTNSVPAPLPYSRNVPGFRGPITALEHPCTAPVMSNDINQFMTTVRRREQGSCNDIPNINCNNAHGSSNNLQHVGYGPRTNYGQSNSGNSSASASPVMVPIDVQHMQTNDSQQNFLCRIQLNPSSNSQSGTPSRGWIFQPATNQNIAYQNVFPGEHNVLQPDTRTLPISQTYTPGNHSCSLTNSPYSSPGEELPAFSGYAGQNKGQHSTQKTIYLTNPTASPNPNQLSTMPRTPVPGHYNPGSVNDVRLSPGNLSRSNSANSQPSPQGYPGSVIVEIKTPVGAGVQSQIKYFETIGSSNTGPHSTTASGAYLSHISPNEPQVPSDTNIKQPYVTRRPNVINFPGGASREERFLKFPPMPNECRVPGHVHGQLQKTPSSDAESVFVSEMEYNRSFVSPASSPNSVSSDSQTALSERERALYYSGSYEEPAYLRALLSHQTSRVEKLMFDLQHAEERLGHLKGDVTNLERLSIERKRQKSNVFPSSVDLARLRSDNLQLQTDIQVMTREIDLFNNGQTPLGVLDPLEQQNFYKNMNTGQRGSIYASTSPVSVPSMQVSRVTTSVNSVVTPSRLPPEIPPQLPPRDPPRTHELPPPLPPRLSVVPPSPQAQAPVTSGDLDADGEQWSCSACTFLNYPALNKCEVCEMPRMSPLMSPRGGEDVPDSYSAPATSPSAT
ncbi:mitogen-activated protein kinase kinase kinase 7-interacting protein 3 homolog isoform X1 [Dreissena polymorpha]|uniref:mitogen-activated protein kinase kinase kinase 7-interacting protein 3 homolog isoform X1 n=1 Tax=Dreissena polymorpha TaxID=45954 RepID=UPI002264A8A8|nr:mitogen-activated protein kinase kinase kinase 7-interacting protein 3 homolog isoform X1 [Dreissena polymorpha]XP_052242716.1 mitogen-activated protein kinase kinase kinase 7-interacting protein 3 homolog isoform X1 [Dreissena polymorpha]XP_052242717.1 mitogen-activated protein kinase kinase kinase 7-interacting protein 3 homolog isoform X1 [Dreissena polymorpha]